MFDLTTVLAGLGDVWTLSNILYIIAGVASSGLKG